MKAKIFYSILVIACITQFTLYAGLASSDRSAFPIYTRTVRTSKPRTVVVTPPPQPPTLSELQNPQQLLTQKQLSEQQRAALQAQEEYKKRQEEIAGYTHMYGTSDLYGGLRPR